MHQREELHKSYVFYVPMYSIFVNKRRDTRELGVGRVKFEEPRLKNKEKRNKSQELRVKSRENVSKRRTPQKQCFLCTYVFGFWKQEKKQESRK